MNQLATSPKLSFQVPRASVDDAIERYLDATFRRFQRVLVEEVPVLEEPRLADPMRALARIATLVEVLAGFAIGSALGQVGGAVRRGFDENVRDAVGAQLAQLPERSTTTMRERLPPRRFLADAARRPLVNELGGRLQVRLCHSIRATRMALARVKHAIERSAPPARAALARTLDRLADDETSALAFADQLALGWRFFTAINTGSCDPVIEDTARWRRGREIWPVWSRRARGLPPRDEQVAVTEYIVRIA